MTFGGADRLVSHPKRPGSLIIFVFFPTLLGVIALVVVWRISWLPFCGYCGPVPMNVHDIVAGAANEIGHGSKEDRLGAVQTLAHYTRRCPNLAPATVPYLSAALSDPEPSVKGAAAISLGALGPHAAAALPALRAAKGSSVAYFDYLLGEASASIRDREPLPIDEGCGVLSPEAFESRRRLLIGRPRPHPVWRPRQGS